MGLFGRRPAEPIRVSVNVRAFLEGRMVRLSLDAQAKRGERLRDLLKRLRRDGVVDAALVRYVLKGSAGVTVLQNGERLSMPQGMATRLADGDQLSILTPMAGG